MSQHAQDQNRKARILVVGSHRFDQRDLVNGLLNGFKISMNLGTIISGPFSGTDEFARDWAKDNGVSYEPLQLQEQDRMKLRFFDESRQLPVQAIRNDAMFRKGFEKIRAAAPDMLIVIPTPEGHLGPTTCCLMKMAETIQLPVMNGAEALRMLEIRLAAAVEQSQALAKDKSLLLPDQKVMVPHNGMMSIESALADVEAEEISRPRSRRFSR